MIVTLCQFKGGVGKTTSAIHFAALLQAKAPTLLIDSDPNKSASLWARKGLLPFDVCLEAEAPKRLMKGNYTHTVIDTPARPSSDEVESIANGTDLLILPTTPDPLSISALIQMAGSLPEDTNYKCLITLVPPPPQKDGADAKAALERHGYPIFQRAVRRYKAYIHAASNGHTVKGPAQNDWKAIWEELSDELG